MCVLFLMKQLFSLLKICVDCFVFIKEAIPVVETGNAHMHKRRGC